MLGLLGHLIIYDSGKMICRIFLIKSKLPASGPIIVSGEESCVCLVNVKKSGLCH